MKDSGGVGDRKGSQAVNVCHVLYRTTCTVAVTCENVCLQNRSVSFPT